MSQQNHRVQYFLGANTACGFVSLYERWIDQKRCQGYYVLKGGPGCGKSTLMRRVAGRLEEAGFRTEQILCSGDPDSLDGVAIPQKGVALVDGTSPHRIDPDYVGATGHYLDLGAAYDREGLQSIRQEVIEGTERYKTCYAEAYRCIRGAVLCQESQRRGMYSESNLNRWEALAKQIAGEVGPSKGEGAVRERFLDGITGQGSVFLGETVSARCQRGILLTGRAGFVVLSHLHRIWTGEGRECVLCRDPAAPWRLRHILLPQEGFCVVTETPESMAPEALDTESIDEKESALESHLVGEFIAEGISHLAEAKRRHDALEQLYRPYVDFSLCDELAERTAEEILALPDTGAEVNVQK